MYNSIKTIEVLLNETLDITTFLIEADKYYASVQKGKSPEKLAEHINLVLDKFKLLCKAHRLDDVLNSLIEDFLHTNQIVDKEHIVHNFMKKLFINTVVFHDYGKINENFQAHPDKMNNPHFKQIESPLSTYHSGLGAYMYIVRHIEEVYTDNNLAKGKNIVIAVVLGFSYVIFKHHAKFLNHKEDIKSKIGFSEKELPFLKKYLEHYQFEIDPKVTSSLFEHNAQLKEINIIYFFNKVEKYLQDFAFYSLMRLAFSLLTASDYLASGEYTSGIKVSSFGTLTRERIEEIYRNITERDFLDEKSRKVNYNKNTYQAFPNYCKLTNPKERNGKNLNILRKEMAFEVIDNIRKHSSESLFYIEAPTGGGKTNLSMLATIELLKANEKLNKVYYVFPFTTLITQTYEAIKQTMGLRDDELIQLHSKASFQNKEEDKDGVYGSDRKNYIDHLFVNYPLCLLSHIQFFNILKTNEKSVNYLLHRLANSVVVIDELQSYNPSHWDKVVYLIRSYAKHYNIKFILMSATLPKIDTLNVVPSETQPFMALLPNAKKLYFQNPNFSKRVKFRLDLLQESDITLAHIVKVLFEKSQQYSQKDFGEAKPLGSVYTIIEFIFKKTATDFYKEVKRRQEDNPFFDEVFVLSGTILEHRRKHIINFLKDPANRKKKILLITTQVVEAGVDIDMDVGFKNQSLIDSDEQLAGRINRNVNKEDCELYLFKVNEPRVLYGSDKRYQAMKYIKEDYTYILENKDFDKLYEIVLKAIDRWNKAEMAIGLPDYIEHIKNMDFRKTHEKFQLIEQKNISVFVPLAIPKDTFTKSDLRFLEKADVPLQNDKVEGAHIFDLYIKLIENKSADFIGRQVNIKTLQGILSKFVFSIFDDSKGKTRRKLIAFADIEKVKKENQSDENQGTTYGYIYLARYKDNQLYSEEFGLDTTKFDDFENAIL